MKHSHEPTSPDNDASTEHASPEQSSAQSQACSPCPICRAAVQHSSETFPFCSARCRTIDLGKWISGDYKITRPIEEADLDQDD